MARAEHSDSVTRFITTARTLPEARWNAPRPGDKWSPAQIAEHVRLSYVTVAAELAGGEGLRVRTFEERLATSAPGQMVTHHVFGRFDARLAWRFMTVHTEHHRRQLSSEPS